MEEGALLGNQSTAVIYNMNKSSSAYFLEAAGSSLLSINMHTASFRLTYGHSEADDLQCTSTCIGVEFQGIILQNVTEMLSLVFFFPQRFHSFLVLPFSYFLSLLPMY